MMATPVTSGRGKETRDLLSDLYTYGSGSQDPQLCALAQRAANIIEKIENKWRDDRNRMTPEYAIWVSMRSRCSNPRNKRYARYKGRGIKVCRRWNSFKLFLKDMGPRPTPKHSLERRNNDGNYEPSNCCWATTIEQANNVSRNRRVVYKGKLLTLAQLVRVSGTPFTAARIRYRLEKGWCIDDALFKTSKYSNRTTDHSLGLESAS